MALLLLEGLPVRPDFSGSPRPASVYMNTIYPSTLLRYRSLSDFNVRVLAPLLVSFGLTNEPGRWPKRRPDQSTKKLIIFSQRRKGAKIINILNAFLCELCAFA
jgi:hypothetical protein